MAASSSGHIGPPTVARQSQISQTGAYLNKPQFDLMSEVVKNKWGVICQIVVKIPPHEEKLLRKYKKVEWEGTGFLIGGNFVVTNHHVLPSRKVAKYAEAYFFQVFSQDENKVKTLVKIVRIAFDPDRYFFASPHKEVQLSQFPNIPPRPLPADQKHLDFAIVPLKQGKEEDLYLHSIQQHVFSIFNLGGREHKPGDFVHIIHHPGVFDSTTLIQGDAKWSSGTLRNICKYFVHYSRMATGGSSGAALMGKEGDLIALNYQTVLVCREGCQSTVSSSSQEVSQDQTVCGCDPKDIVLPLDSGCCSGVMMDRIVEYLSSELNGVTQKDVIEGLILQDRARYPKYLSEQLIEYYRQERTSVGSNLMNIIDSLDDFCIERVYSTLKPLDSSFTDQSTKNKQDQQTTISASELFKHEALANNPRKRVMVVGDAGMGKTGLCEEIALHGSEWYPRFSTVFFIRLRNLNERNYPIHKITVDKREKGHSNRSKDYTVYEVLAQENGFISEEFEGILREEWFRKDLLIVLDGLDELPSEAQGGSGPLKNIFKDILGTFDHVLITSRRKIGGSSPFRAVIDDFCQFELTGFNNQNINLYIRKFYEELHRLGRVSSEVAETKITRLRQEFEGRPDLYSLLQIPIILTLACSLFSQNSDIFNSTQTFSLTKFYALTVDWFYRWSLLRSTQSVGLSSSTILEESEPSLITPNIKEISEVLQISAWESKKGGTIGQSISHNRRGKSFIDADLKDIGIVKFESTGWEFIHSTFQDYFAAAYLANLYLDERFEETKQYLIQIKFDPNYNLILRMTAGYLSYKRNDTALQAFFDNLFDEPHDLARGYELRLIAQCFEECENPESIRQYSSFVKNCAQYIHNTPSSGAIFKLMNRNVKLFHHESIVDIFCSQIFLGLRNMKPGKHTEIILVLWQLASTTQVLPDRVIKELTLVASQFFANDYARTYAIWTLSEVVRGSKAVSQDILDTLVSIIIVPQIGSFDVDTWTGLGVIDDLFKIVAERGINADIAMNAITTITQYHPVLPPELFYNRSNSLVQHAQKKLGEYRFGISAIKFDLPVAVCKSQERNGYSKTKILLKGGNTNSEELVNELVENFINNKYLGTRDLVYAAKSGNFFSLEALQKLEMMAKELMLGSPKSHSLYEIITSISLESLIRVVKDIDSCKVVLRICFLTMRGFIVSAGQIHLFDSTNKVVLDVLDIDLRELEIFANEELFNVAPSCDSSSSSSIVESMQPQVSSSNMCGIESI